MKEEGGMQKEEGIPIGDWVDSDVDRTGPKGDGEFVYIDISSIDRFSKRITEPKELPVDKAPSRAKQVLRAGDVLVSMTRPNLNAVSQVPAHLDGSIGSTGFHVLRPKHADSGFLFYAVQTRKFVEAMSMKVQGALYPAVRPNDVSAFCLPPFALGYQRKLVARIEELFSELDAGEESLRLARRQLGVYRQSLLKQAFEGKLTAPWRKQNPDLLASPDQLLSRIHAEREARYEQQLSDWETAVEKWVSNGENGKKPTKPRPPKDSDPIAKGELRHLPELPTGWIYARLSESIVNIDAGKSFSCDERPPSGDEIGVAKVSAVTWGEYDEAESKTCRDADKIVPEYYIKPGDFLLSRANTIELVGAVVIVKRTTKNVMLSDKTLRIHFAGIEPHYILQYLRCRTGRLEIMERSTGNQESMRNIGQDRIGAVITPLCSLPEQQEIVRLLDEQFTVIEQNEREIAAALKRSEALRQSILKKAFTGQLVPQDPTDEPAHELLARIQAERETAQALSKPKKTGSRK